MDRAAPQPLWLFSYGSLRQADVQRALFSREPDCKPDTLSGFAASPLRITDPAVIATSGSADHLILRRTDDVGDRIEGVAIALTADELASADAYEVEDYIRIQVRLDSGRIAFVYVEGAAP